MPVKEKQVIPLPMISMEDAQTKDVDTLLHEQLGVPKKYADDIQELTTKVMDSIKALNSYVDERNEKRGPTEPEMVIVNNGSIFVGYGAQIIDRKEVVAINLATITTSYNVGHPSALQAGHAAIQQHYQRQMQEVMGKVADNLQEEAKADGKAV